MDASRKEKQEKISMVNSQCYRSSVWREGQLPGWPGVCIGQTHPTRGQCCNTRCEEIPSPLQELCPSFRLDGATKNEDTWGNVKKSARTDTVGTIGLAGGPAYPARQVRARLPRCLWSHGKSESTGCYLDSPHMLLGSPHSWAQERLVFSLALKVVFMKCLQG